MMYLTELIRRIDSQNLIIFVNTSKVYWDKYVERDQPISTTKFYTFSSGSGIDRVPIYFKVVFSRNWE